ncbi:unnamed protein product [Dicrocoelium dendriticum]|nr:unnamed protein product [Dicrocoelium dendriticum]
MHEAKFNLACLSIGKGDDSKAQSLLEEAEIVCRRVLRDDPEVTEDDINEELAPIRIQQAFLLQRAKKEEEANQIYQSVTRNRNADSALLAVAANNIVCINREQNIFDSRKRIKMASLDGLQHKLFAKQREEMLLNQALFYWHTNQMDACQAKVKHVFQSNPHSSRALLLSITQLLREKQYSRAITLLQNDCSSNKASPDNTDGPGVELSVLLALAQLYLRYSKEKGQFFTGCPRSEQALSTDEFLSQNLPTPLLHSSGIVCTRIALHLIASSGDDVALERKEALLRIADIIQSALDWYEFIDNQHPSYGELLEHCATFLLQQGQASLAARLFERQLDRLDASSSHADEKQRSVAKQGIIARLVSAYAQFDPPKAELACRTLKFSNQLTEADVDSLETVFLYGAKTLKRHGRTAGEHGTTGETKSIPADKQHAPTSDVTEAVQLAQTKNTRRKKKRRVRLPKNYQPGVIPDPDRWLPRRERANYRGKRRDKRYQPSRGPQGQVSGVCEWDASVRSPKASTTVNPPVEGITSNTKQVSGAARQQQRKGRRKGGR